MRKVPRMLRVWSLIFVAAGVLAACGGGGGGGSGEARPPGEGSTTPPSASSFPGSVSLKSPLIRDVTYAGLPAHEQNIVIGYEGDASALIGHAVYLNVVQPDNMYIADSQVERIDGPSLVLKLHGNPDHAFSAGPSRGTLQVFICIDTPDCTTQVRNSPLQVDYDIDVRPGLELSAESIQQSTNFGTAAPARTITVTKPAQAESWSYGALRASDGAHPSSSSVVPNWFKRAGDTLTFAPPADLIPGTYAVEFQFVTVVPDALTPGFPQQIVRKMLVSHTVVATGTFAAMPSSVEIRQSLSGQPADLPQPALVTQVGGGFLRLGVRLDSHPPEAEGHPLLATWLVDGRTPNLSESSYLVRYCDFGRQPVVCLPEGTYRGAQLMRYTARDGVITDFEIPITLHLEP
jgi:hypothetical protein